MFAVATNRSTMSMPPRSSPDATVTGVACAIVPADG